MDKKYILVETGEEVPVGKTFEWTTKKNIPYGVITTTHSIYLDEYSIPHLLKHNIIAEKKDETIPTMEYYMDKYATKRGWTKEDCEAFFAMLSEVNPATSLSLLLKTIAVDLDKKYPDYIGDSPEIYCISLINGKITKVPKGSIKNYKNFAAFRTIEDAKTACSICKPLLKYCFHE